eukprot:912516-Rhodomonas_salina.1
MKAGCFNFSWRSAKGEKEVPSAVINRKLEPDFANAPSTAETQSAATSQRSEAESAASTRQNSGLGQEGKRKVTPLDRQIEPKGAAPVGSAERQSTARTSGMPPSNVDPYKRKVTPLDRQIVPKTMAPVMAPPIRYEVWVLPEHRVSMPPRPCSGLEFPM